MRQFDVGVVFVLHCLLCNGIAGYKVTMTSTALNPKPIYKIKVEYNSAIRKMERLAMLPGLFKCTILQTVS